MTEIINKLLSLGTLLSHIFLIIAIILLLIKKEKNFIKDFFGKHGLLFAWLIALFSAVLSLYYSEIVGFEPCSLCWWQRVFIYPQAIFLGIAYFKKEFQHSSLYAIVLSIIGGVIGIYQNALYYGAPQIGACDGSATAVSCTKLYILEFGYITIPIMSLTAFLLIIFFLNLARKSK
ncbi:MAG: disulfide bond formation protein DsbB [uncultured bacterium]|nr:MAG: disulfide bond formation protein DsbB [uncultured bacterium]HAO52044.1 disulfide bond formation protein B [Candidatus Magasanikbacteria bacterium]